MTTTFLLTMCAPLVIRKLNSFQIFGLTFWDHKINAKNEL